MQFNGARIFTKRTILLWIAFILCALWFSLDFFFENKISPQSNFVANKIHSPNKKQAKMVGNQKTHEKRNPLSLIENVVLKSKSLKGQDLYHFLELNKQKILSLSDDEIVFLTNGINGEEREVFQSFLCNSLAFSNLNDSKRLESIIRSNKLNPPISQLSAIYVKDILYRDPSDFQNLLTFVTSIKNKDDQYSTYSKIFAELAVNHPKLLGSVYHELDFENSDSEAVKLLILRHAGIVGKTDDIYEMMAERINIPDRFSKDFDRTLILNLEHKPELATEYLNFIKETYDENHFVFATSEYFKTASKNDPIRFFEWIADSGLNHDNQENLLGIVVAANAIQNYDTLLDYFSKNNNEKWIKTLQKYKHK